MVWDAQSMHMILFGGVTGSGSALVVAVFLKAGQDLMSAAMSSGLVADPPDKILQVVHERTSGRPFESIGDVISPQELTDITSQYKAVAGYTLDELKTAS